MTCDANQSVLDKIIVERANERIAMRDPSNTHPLVGSRHWRLISAQLAEALADAEITGEIDCTDSCTLVFGYLGPSRGHLPFICARTDESTWHTMICPGMED